MTPEELRHLISQSESDVLEYKVNIPDPTLVARIVSAFANSKGGILVVGVRDDVKGNRIIGVSDVERAEKVLQQAQQRIMPSLDLLSEIISVDDKPILVVTIPKGQQSPYFIDGEVFQRIGARIQKASVIAPDVHTSAYQAVVSGSGAIAQGSGAITAGEKGILVGESVGSITITHQDVVPYDKAFERVAGSTAFVLNQLEFSYRQTREQAQGWYRFSVVAAVVGFILVGIGVVAVIIGLTTAGIITAVAGIVPEVVAGLFFVQSTRANQRVDAIQKNLADAREVQAAVEIVDTIENPQERDKLKAEIVRKTLRIKIDNSK